MIIQDIKIPQSMIYIGEYGLMPSSEDIKSGKGVMLDSEKCPIDNRWNKVGVTIGEGSWIVEEDTFELEIDERVIPYFHDLNLVWKEEYRTLTEMRII